MRPHAVGFAFHRYDKNSFHEQSSSQRNERFKTPTGAANT
jgi:hypothetical protein